MAWLPLLVAALLAPPSAADGPTALALPKSVVRALPAVEVPVLAPDVGGLDDRVTLTHGPGWYTLALHGDGLHVSVLGQSRTHDHPALRKVRPEPGPRISHAHGIWSASVERFGVSYTVDLECARPGEDARCADDATVRALVDALVRVDPVRVDR